MRLAEAEVWRAGIVRAEDTGRTLLALTVHHIAFDEWSQGVLCTDLSQAYQARLEKRRQALRLAPTLSQVVGEYRRQLRHSDGDVQRAYWRSALRGLPPLHIPAGQDDASDASGELSWEITAAELAAWGQAARAHETTRFVVLLVL
ncbi:condensation domain-containing protein [Streptomyces fagopyri]|uniref:condensation domain-containing protein n=1 Tax=Streptomyces fagopyri TaxID=2662397 RepID=UPI0036BE99EB